MPRSRLRRPPGGLALALAVLVGSVGSAGLLVSANQRADEVERVPGLRDVLETRQDVVTANYLLVGSDSREGVDANDPNADAIGSDDAVVGRRSDTIMILRQDENGGASLLSVPRDLWVEIAGTGREAKINSAYNGGADRLAATVTQSLGIPIHHYVEVDFVGFTRMVDEMGGVEMCFFHATRDTHSGLDVQPGCHDFNGAQALAYTRSRHYEEFRDGDWTEDPRADLGRIERQQLFIRRAVTQMLDEVRNDPFALGDLITAATGAVRMDEEVDPVDAANALRTAADEGLNTYTLPVVGVERDDQSALELDTGAQQILDYFRGTGPLPPPSTSTTTEPG